MKTKFFILGALVAVTAIISCKELNESNNTVPFSVIPTSLSIPAQGKTVQIAISAPSTWAITSGADWIVTAPTAGAKGESVVNVTVKENSTDKERQDIISIEAGKEVITVPVSQQAGKSAEDRPAKWYVCGNFNEWNMDTALEMGENTFERYYYVTLDAPEKLEFKFYLDKDWNVNLGAWDQSKPGTNHSAAIHESDYVPLIKDGFNLFFVPGGKISIRLYYYDDKNDYDSFSTKIIGGNPDPGYEDDPSGKTIGEKDWSIVGKVHDANGDYDIPMLKMYSSTGEEFWWGCVFCRPEESFKLRQGGKWDVNRGVGDSGSSGMELNQYGEYPVVQDGGPIIVKTTTMLSVYYYPLSEKLVIQNGNSGVWSIIGEFDPGTTYNWNKNYSMNAAYAYGNNGTPGRAFYYRYITIKDEEFRFRFNGESVFSYGFDGSRLNLPEVWLSYEYVFDLTTNGLNITATPGDYSFELDPMTGKLSVRQYENRRITMSGGVQRNDHNTFHIEAGINVSKAWYALFDGQIDMDDWSVREEYGKRILSGDVPSHELPLSSFKVKGNPQYYYGSVDCHPEKEGYYTALAIVPEGEYFSYSYAQSFYYKPVQTGLTWTSIGKATLYEPFLSVFYPDDMPATSWEVNVERCDQDPTRIRMKYPYDAKCPYIGQGMYDTSKSYDIEICIPDNQHVYMLPQEIGCNFGNGNFTIANWAGVLLACGREMSSVSDEFFGTFDGQTITFPLAHTVSQEPDYSSSWYISKTDQPFRLVLGNSLNSASKQPVQKRPMTLRHHDGESLNSPQGSGMISR